MAEGASGYQDTDIAIVGLACRFAGANNPHEYWRNLREGVECIRPLSSEELEVAGVDPVLLHHPRYVRVAAPIDDIAGFDAEFFGLSAREAQVMDPQHRHFLEVCWEGLESSGHMPERFPGPIGVFAGSGMNAYMPYNLFTNRDPMASMGLFLTRHTGNDKDFLTTRVSYCLNLRGPSVNVQTACSTSLVAAHYASQSLLSGECDMALAGGVTIEMPPYHGYLYVEGEILSPDGKCRPFDVNARGTVFGSGCGVVVLRRLADAMSDGDTIYAVIKGSAVNNDGATKVGYLAPSVDGQAESIVEALNISGVSARDVSYVECHGTGTPVGDPIEIAALTQAYRTQTDDVGFCQVGSVKANIGHTDNAAGVASLIKVALMLKHRELVPTLHFEEPNPECRFDLSPFSVCAAQQAWMCDGDRFAGVSSLGVGGTNAHLLLQQPPSSEERSSAEDRYVVLNVSARSARATQTALRRLADHLESDSSATDLRDVSFTLREGRRRFGYGAAVPVRTDTAAECLRQKADQPTFECLRGTPSSVLMFPGGGAQHFGMLSDLYEGDPRFRNDVNEGLACAQSAWNLDLKAWFLGNPVDDPALMATATQPSFALPALLIAEVALAKRWRSWGLTPDAMIGHSLGEYAAAHVAGVFSLEHAIGIVRKRGELFESLPRGAMLSVSLGEEDLRAELSPELCIAALNGPQSSVASGPEEAIDVLAARLESRDIDVRKLRIDVAAHSSMLDTILVPFGAFLRDIVFHEPTVPFVSNTSGEWADPDDVQTPDYWVQHLRQTVRFADGLRFLVERFKSAGLVLIECGPGQSLTSLARGATQLDGHCRVVSSARHVREETDDAMVLLEARGQVALHGVTLPDVQEEEGVPAQRVPLPTYPFEHSRHWVEPGMMLPGLASS